MKYEILQYRHGDGIVKATINDFWLCSLKKGSIYLNCDLTEYKLSGKTIFVVSEGAPFKVLDSSDNMELEVIVFGTQFMNVVYSLECIPLSYFKEEYADAVKQILGKWFPYGIPEKI